MLDGLKVMRHLLVSLGMIALAFSIGTGVAAAHSGQFIVVEARRDPGVTNAQAQYTDPQLVNRIISFSASGVSFDAGASTCAHATETTTNLTVAKLFRQVMYPRDKPGYSKFARPIDFGLKLSPQTIIPITRFRCRPAVSNDGSDWTRAALFLIGKGIYALSLIPNYLLILKPAPSRITASFNCAKASSPAERTICSDPVLAGWDRSVQLAYDNHGDVDEQRAWLAERDKCSTNKSCLQGAMSLRVMNLK